MVSSILNRKSVLGVVLAGGLSRRMEGSDKSFKQLADQDLLAHVLDRFVPQLDETIINANGDPDDFHAYSQNIVRDVFDGFAGPLAGVVTGMSWAKENRPDVSHVMTIPCDGPFLPLDYAMQMIDGLKEADIVMASSNGRTHPVAGLWPVKLCDDLAKALDQGVRKVDLWTADYAVNVIDFPLVGDADDIDPFFNANRPGDLETAEELFTKLQTLEN
jgi:molybdopterin-guanine dinucleotide biosynthesis protein A